MKSSSFSQCMRGLFYGVFLIPLTAWAILDNLTSNETPGDPSTWSDGLLLMVLPILLLAILLAAMTIEILIFSILENIAFRKNTPHPLYARLGVVSYSIIGISYSSFTLLYCLNGLFSLAIAVNPITARLVIMLVRSSYEGRRRLSPSGYLFVFISSQVLARNIHGFVEGHI
ncbi:hypothetical protein ONV78_07770 [Hahella sp. CR1]|uniref:hypothetical protein n=1 Tax=Hahella sp. CR1 TaxID=2992807 RepID=UPI0024435DC4|nr:hypothetical protein [Hahella sp. CR1]MDG9667624.1 hypothetical protein [Hahella sp. CR1]